MLKNMNPVQAYHHLDLPPSDEVGAVQREDFGVKLTGYLAHFRRDQFTSLSSFSTAAPVIPRAVIIGRLHKI